MLKTLVSINDTNLHDEGNLKVMIRITHSTSLPQHNDIHNDTILLDPK